MPPAEVPTATATHDAALPTLSPAGPPSSAGSSVAAPTPMYHRADKYGPALNVPVPVLPAEAKRRTKEGLEAFARFWYSTLSYAYETGDTGPMEAVSEAGCRSCGRVKEVVEGWHSGGRWLEGGRMTVLAAQSEFVETAPDEYQVILMVRQEPISYYNPDRTLNEASEADPAIGDILVAKYAGGAWTATTVEHIRN